MVLQRRRAVSALCLPTRLLLVLGLSASIWRASGWKDCSISPGDEWKEATETTLAMQMRQQYDRIYTCTTSEEGSFEAAKYYFDSPCLAKRFFHPPDVQECLKGRRVIFLGDSLTNQQGDSLVGMLGWNPEWMPIGGFRNNKRDYDENGTLYFTLVDCWHPPEGHVHGIQRCYDLFDVDFSSPDEASHKPSVTVTVDVPATASTENDDTRMRRSRRRTLGEEEGEGDEEEEGKTDSGYHEVEETVETAEDDEGKDATSVHVRMVCRPTGEDWLTTAVRDFNETRASDVFVVNFGAHYPANPEGEDDFKQDVAPLLDDMAKLGGNATVIWREMSPVHFPSLNGSYDTFIDLDLGNTVCCTGTPPKVLDRNLWVENYIKDNGLSDRVKILRIYDMSAPRGAAHHTCHGAPPSTMDQTGVEANFCHSTYRTDCTHWSETGVVEEWNALLLNHICPAE